MIFWIQPISKDLKKKKSLKEAREEQSRNILNCIESQNLNDTQ